MVGLAVGRRSGYGHAPQVFPLVAVRSITMVTEEFGFSKFSQNAFYRAQNAPPSSPWRMWAPASGSSI